MPSMGSMRSPRREAASARKKRHQELAAERRQHKERAAEARKATAGGGAGATGAAVSAAGTSTGLAMAAYFGSRRVGRVLGLAMALRLKLCSLVRRFECGPCSCPHSCIGQRINGSAVDCCACGACFALALASVIARYRHTSFLFEIHFQPFWPRRLPYRGLCSSRK